MPLLRALLPLTLPCKKDQRGIARAQGPHRRPLLLPLRPWTLRMAAWLTTSHSLMPVLSPTYPRYSSKSQSLVAAREG